MASYTGVGFILIFVSCTTGERLGCPEICSCPDTPPCPPATPRVQDTCGCGCEVCMQDLGAQCNGLRPCDRTKNLTCDYRRDPDRQQGVCQVLEERRSCFQNGSEILHGQEFRIACDSSCKCEDGSIDCVPLCPDTQPPLIPHCKEVQSVTVPGECCLQWRCSEQSGRIQERTIHQPRDINPQDASVAADTEEDPVSVEDSPLCKPDTEWTPCSRSCGFGNSVRITYEKESCTPKAERRLCMIRPCKGQYANANYTVLKTTNVCSRVIRWSQPLHLRYRDCLSLRPMLPKFCGHCSDGRFCAPSMSTTRPVSFQCAHLGRKTTRQVMWVKRCHCGGKKGKKRADKVMESGEETTNEVEEED
ncbi:CCN family member 5-like [Mixophyes fleayi]|uniref:CCN family member 5-like n=1 Tax=Mixophyes fleayi TaxID=3061075 RepID=UPI003F4D818A